MLTKRTSILFSKSMWQDLTALAQKRDTSAADLIRSAVEERYLSNTPDERIKNAYESIIKNRTTATGRVDYKALVNQGRRV